MRADIPKPWDAFLKDLDEAVEDAVELHCIGGFVVASTDPDGYAERSTPLRADRGSRPATHVEPKPASSRGCGSTRAADDRTTAELGLSPMPAGRLIGLNQLRLTPGDLASARVGPVVKRQHHVRAEQGSYRLQFQLLRADRAVRAAPSP